MWLVCRPVVCLSHTGGAMTGPKPRPTTWSMHIWLLIECGPAGLLYTWVQRCCLYALFLSFVRGANSEPNQTGFILSIMAVFPVAAPAVGSRRRGSWLHASGRPGWRDMPGVQPPGRPGEIDTPENQNIKNYSVLRCQKIIDRHAAQPITRIVRVNRHHPCHNTPTARTDRHQACSL